MTTEARYHSYVRADDGVRLAVQECGREDGPVVLLVHGFPDDHRVRDAMLPGLKSDCRLIMLDTRGSGASDRPTAVRAYTLQRLAADLEHVIEQMADGRPVHLVGHDWGSVQGWHLVTTSSARIASFTSISGPSLDHVPGWVRARSREGLSGWRKIAAMWKSPLYMTLFQVPVLAPLLCRFGVVDAIIAGARRLEGPAATDDPGSIGLARKNRAALKIYTANVFPRLLRPRRRGTTVPVQVLAPRRDLFVPMSTQVDVDPWVVDPRVEVVDGGHWAPRRHGLALARAVVDWVARHDEDLAPEVEERSTRDGVTPQHSA